MDSKNERFNEMNDMAPSCLLKNLGRTRTPCPNLTIKNTGQLAVSKEDQVWGNENYEKPEFGTSKHLKIPIVSLNVH